MEESIKNAEKLIEAANAALVRMKRDSSRDDINYILGINSPERRKQGRNPSRRDDGGTGNGIPNWEELFGWDNFHGVRRSWTPTSGEKIAEINNKIESYEQELLRKEERESVKALQVEMKELSMSDRMERLLPAVKAAASDTNLSQRSLTKASPSFGKITEDLKSKLLQTQEVVDRGIQTARELSETVEILKSKPFASDRFDVGSFTHKSKSWERLAEKSDSRSTVKSARGKRCKKCDAEITSRRSSGGKVRRNEENVSVMRVRGSDADPPPSTSRRLHLQRLPHLSIQGDLNYQRIPSVDIPPGKRECPPRSNTTFESYSHDQILRERIGKIVEDVKKSNCFCRPDVEKKARSVVECGHCGNVIKVSNDRAIDCERIDDLLKACNYDVFDPRIDEFVEMCGGRSDEVVRGTQTDGGPGKTATPSKGKREKDGDRGRNVGPAAECSASNRPEERKRKPKIREFSNELTRKYREKAAELESGHMRFEGILRDLFRRIDESREFFEDRDVREDLVKRKSNLSVTSPMMVSYTGSGEEVDDGSNAVIRPTARRYRKMSKDGKKKTEKKEPSTNCKLLSSSRPFNKKKKPGDSSDRDGFGARKFPDRLPRSGVRRGRSVTFRMGSDTDDSLSLDGGVARNEFIQHPEIRPDEGARLLHPTPVIASSEPFVEPCIATVEFDAPPPVEANAGESIGIDEEVRDVEEVAGNTESDYESDFEDESAEEVPPESCEGDLDPVADEDDSHKYNRRLSTISEVDSDMDRRLSDVAVSPKSGDDADGIGSREDEPRMLPRPESSSEMAEEDVAESRTGKDSVVVEGTGADVEPNRSRTKRLPSTPSASSDDDTRKLLKKVNRDLEEVASQQLQKDSPIINRLPKEVTQPLMKVLGELKSQFERTESLADKLTESIREVKNGKTDCRARSSPRVKDPRLSADEPGSTIVDNLLRARKDVGHGVESVIGGNSATGGVDFFKTLRLSSAGGGVDEEEAGRDRKWLDSPRYVQSPKQRSVAMAGSGEGLPAADAETVAEEIGSRSKKVRDSGSGDNSYSEGEIPEQNVSTAESISPSIGELIDENISDGSSSEENSAMQFP